NTNNAYYLTSLQSAVDRVITDGEGSLKLLTDVELSASVTVDAPISLDLAGKTLTGPADAPIFDFASQAIVTITTSGGELVSEIGPMSCAPLGGVVIDGVNVDPNTCHDIEHFAAKPATCTEDGNLEYWHCTVCDDYVLDEEFTLIITEEGTVTGATGHTTTHFNASEPSCTDDGNIEYWYCAACDTYATDSEMTEVITKAGTVAEATGHTTTHFAAVAPTCTEDGNIEYWYCAVCDTYATDSEMTKVITKAETVTEATGHQNIVAIPAVDATCTKDGATAGEKCADCGTVTKAPQVIAAYHDEYNMRDKAATCTADGYTGGIGCYVCGETVVEPTVIPATGHTPVAVAGKAATCTETGLTEGTKCSVCDATIEAQKVVAKLAHKYADGKCTVCGEAEAAASQPTTSSATSAPTTSETTSAPTTSETASTPASSTPVVPSEPIVTSDGTTVKTDGSYVVADGTVVENDGTIVKTDGTVIKPDEAVAEIEETVVKVENEEEIKEAVPMTQEEETKVAEGAKVEVWVEVKDASATVNEETKKIITDAMEDNRVGMFLDVDMFKQVVTEDEAPSAENATQLTKLNEKVTISFELPKALVAPTTAVVRQYFIVRVHDGVADLIPAKFDEATGKLSFETDRFSNYAVVYTDTVKADLVLPSTGSPADSTPWMWISVLALVVGAAFVLVARKQRTNA
ncbi:MAG: hypothetical protein IJC25_00205, partial [Clostridia bacterium]|nr:hypothetical protein [Clostridia bacterium]